MNTIITLAYCIMVGFGLLMLLVSIFSGIMEFICNIPAHLAVWWQNRRVR